MKEPTWRVSKPPTDRQFLTLAIAAGTLHEAVMIVAKWDETVKNSGP